MARVNIDILTDTHGSETKLDKVKGALGGMGGEADTAKNALGGMFFKMAAGLLTLAAVKKAFDFLSGSITAASDSQETYSKFGTIFNSVLREANKEAGNLADNYGLSETASREMLSATGDLLTGLGMTAKAALELSMKTQELAVDLASFTNYSGGAEGASLALTRAMLGEYEALKSLGISINDKNIKQEMAKRGTEKATGAVYLQEKALAILQIAMSQSKNALGDFERTSKDYANQQRILKAGLEDLNVELGKVFLPLMTTVTREANDVVKGIKKWREENSDLASSIATAIVVSGPLLATIIALNKVLPVLAKQFTAAKLAATASIGALALLAVAAGAVHDAISKATKATEAATEADYRNFTAGEKLTNKLKDIADKAGLTRKEFHQLSLKYGENSQALAIAILKGDEGVELQKAMTEKGKENTEEIKKQAAALAADLIPAYEDTKTKVESLTEYLKTQGITAIIDKRNRVGELKTHLGNLKTAYEKGEITLADYTKASKAAKDEVELLASEIDGTRKAEELLTNYLKDQGISTIQEKDEKVAELKTTLGLLEKAYEDGRISLDDYTVGTRAAKKEIELLSTSIVDTAIPAARDMAGVYDQAVMDMDDRMGEFVRTFKQKISKIDLAWKALALDIKSAFEGLVANLILSGGDLKAALDDLWSDIKEAFAKKVGEMVVDWVAGMLFMKKAAGTVELAAGATAAATVGIGTAAAATAPVVGASFAAMLTPIAVVAAAVIAVLGVFYLIIKALEKIFGWKGTGVPWKAPPLVPPGKDESKGIAPLESTGVGPGPGFASGGAFIPSGATPIMVHPRELVDITPLSELRSSGRSRAGMGFDGGGGGGTQAIYLDGQRVGEILASHITQLIRQGKIQIDMQSLIVSEG